LCNREYSPSQIAGTTARGTCFSLEGRRATYRASAGNGNGGTMLYWALVFFIVAIIAAIFGFGGIAVAAAGIAKILFFVFLVIFVVALISGLVARRGPTI
jgi:uncharacterized membrane protein YtjA (UPF0391 family)